MKTSNIFLKVVVFLILASAISINSSVTKAQCSFSLGVLDSTHSLTFATIPGSIDTQKILIVNTSASQLTLSIHLLSSKPAFQFRLLDSNKTIPPGSSDFISVRFQPSTTTNGTVTGKMYIKDDKLICRDTFNLVGIVKPNLCLETEHELTYQDPVIIGTTAEHKFRLTNQSGANIVITNVGLDDSVTSGFHITSALPMIVAPHSSDQFLTYTFSPTNDFNGSFFNTTFATIGLTGDSVGCPSVTVLLIGNVAKPGGGGGIDTNLRPLFPSSTRTLVIEGSGQPTTMQFKFTNNLNVITSVSKVYLKDGIYFTLVSTNPTPTPFTLSPDQTMTATVNYKGTGQIVQTDSLMIEASHNLQTTAFALQGVQLSSGVPLNTLPKSVIVSVSPNPSSGNITVTMSGVNNGSIQIFDLLGKEIVAGRSNSEWKWEHAATPSGVYIVRISGESLDHEHFIISKRIILN